MAGSVRRGVMARAVVLPAVSGYGLNAYLLGKLSSVVSCRIIEYRGNAPIWLANDEHKTAIILESPSSGKYGIRGETADL
ncbi:hypothetical protein [Streptosporangium canum]|uniref:hypothetical protein n=1 Tax=Streptosporangium canum TaxID=324952 RepID=UPI0011603156|nr:hypothetical protein [Streptosporangium canum]